MDRGDDRAREAVPDVYIDTSVYAAKPYPPEHVRYMRADGRTKVLFGSKYPMILPEKAPRYLDALGLDADARELFLHGNARRVFRLS